MTDNQDRMRLLALTTYTRATMAFLNASRLNLLAAHTCTHVANSSLLPPCPVRLPGRALDPLSPSRPHPPCPPAGSA
jgi:hypothetical protein